MDSYALIQVLAAFEQAELFEGLMWRTADDGGIKLFAQCNDVFAWATADCEEITDDDVPVLQQALRDLQVTKEEYYLPELFVARKRHLRPQKPFYKGMTPATAALFDACCTEAERAEFDRKDREFWLSVAHRARPR